MAAPAKHPAGIHSYINVGAPYFHVSGNIQPTQCADIVVDHPSMPAFVGNFHKCLPLFGGVRGQRLVDFFSDFEIQNLFRFEIFSGFNQSTADTVS